MKQHDEKPISMLLRYCLMYNYGSDGSPDLLTNEVARDFLSFALLHLTCTMFITTDPPDSHQGIFHRILDPMGQSHLLTEIDDILNLSFGNTTLRQFVRSKRNKLATHGTLAFSSQPDHVQEITFDETSLQQYEDAMCKMDQAVLRLTLELKRLEEAQGRPR